MVSEAGRRPFPLTGRRLPGVVPLVGTLLVLLVLVWLAINLVRTPSDFFTVLLFGMTNGAVYGLIALGYTLVYGILELINFAHGDVFMIGGMTTATFLLSVFNLGADPSATSLWPAIVATLLVAMLVCGLLNVTVERVGYRPLRHAPRLAPLITAIAMSFIIQNIGLAWKGPAYITTPPLLPHGAVFTVGGVTYTWNKFIVVLITIPVLVALTYLVQRTRHPRETQGCWRSESRVGCILRARRRQSHQTL